MGAFTEEELDTLARAFSFAGFHDEHDDDPAACLACRAINALEAAR